MFTYIKSFFKKCVNCIYNLFGLKDNVALKDSKTREQLLELVQTVTNSRDILSDDGKEYADQFLSSINDHINSLPFNESNDGQPTELGSTDKHEEFKSEDDSDLNEHNHKQKLIELEQIITNNKIIYNDNDKEWAELFLDVIHKQINDLSSNESINKQLTDKSISQQPKYSLEENIIDENKNQVTKETVDNINNLTKCIKDESKINDKKDIKANKKGKNDVIKIDPKILQAKKDDLFDKIEYGTRDGIDTSAFEKELTVLLKDPEESKHLIQYAKKRGNELKTELNTLKNLLKKGVDSKEVIDYWQDLPNRANWFKNKALKEIKFVLNKEIKNLNDPNKAKLLIDKAVSIYGIHPADIIKIPTDKKVSTNHTFTPIVQSTNHTLYTRNSVNEWKIIIDETGTKFSSSEQGTEGRVVAVCIPEGENLPNIGKFHCSESNIHDTIIHCNTLLNSNCGILGLSQESLEIKGENGWLQCIQELITWVWRLIPVPKNKDCVVLHYFIEGRSEFTPELETSLSEKLLLAEFVHEDPDRAKQVRLSSLEIYNKDSRGLAWADIICYLWGSKSLSKQLSESGLLGTSFVACTPSVLKTCEIIFKKQFPNESQWIELFENAGRKNSLQEQALILLQEQCQKYPENWKTYAKAMQKYLADKKYSLSILEKMSTWLHKMENPGLEAEYFYYSAELARLNHMGDVDSQKLKDTIAALEKLTPQVQATDPIARLHVMLRLAVSDSNSFDFAKAEGRLAEWNPVIGGKLIGTALWDGKIFSSLGQYRAFQNDFIDAVYLFRKAIDSFEILKNVNPNEGSRQISQTSTYLAIAIMDMPLVQPENVRDAVEEALGCKIEDAIQTIGTETEVKNPYPLYLLTRYIAYHGTQEDCAAYNNSTNAYWTNSNITDHPWPQIQYFRWLITDDHTLEDNLKNSIKTYIENYNNVDENPTVKLITLAIALSMGVFSAKDDYIQDALAKLDLRS